MTNKNYQQKHLTIYIIYIILIVNMNVVTALSSEIARQAEGEK